ncbi:MAG: hypothetical protein JRF33_26170 [Deltaproteobacteria bacterium]|nr:hypothetical protein [Deltaproteobacteria bacterium]
MPKRNVLLSFLLMPAFFLAACETKQQNDPTVDTSSPSGVIQKQNDKKADDDLPFRAMLTSSRFEKEIHAAAQGELRPASSAVKFRWDFSADKSYLYDFRQKVVSKSYGETNRDSSASLNGRLSMKSKGDGTADMGLDQMRAQMNFGQKKEPKTKPLKIPPMAMPGISEDGSLPAGSNPQAILTRFLFPFPEEALATGATAQIPLHVPFNAGGSPLTVKGEARVKMMGLIERDGRTLACLEVTYDISDLDVPKELNGDYGCSTRGRALIFYDVKDRALESADMAIVMGIRASVPNSPIQTAMDNDYHIQIVRKR